MPSRVRQLAFRSGGTIAALALVLVSAMVGGCATAVPASAAGWLDGGTLLMRSIDRARFRFERIRVAADDRLEWNGGFEALGESKPQFETPLDEIDLERLRSALRGIGWLGDDEPILDPRIPTPRSDEGRTEDPALVRFVLRVPRAVGGSHEIETSIEDERFAGLAEVLRDLARRRLDPILGDLPHADEVPEAVDRADD